MGDIAGKVDMISFYTDSPRLGVRNVHAAEKSQDRLGATLWQQPQKYVAHSAIMFAVRIQTPLMLITGAQDSNVPEINSQPIHQYIPRLTATTTELGSVMNTCQFGSGNVTALSNQTSPYAPCKPRYTYAAVDVACGVLSL